MDPVEEGKADVPDCEPLLFGEELGLLDKLHEELIVAVKDPLRLAFVVTLRLDGVVEMILVEAVVEFIGVGKNCVGSGKSVAGEVESKVVILVVASEEDMLTEGDDGTDVTVSFNVTGPERELVVAATTLLLLKGKETVRTADDDPLNVLPKLKVERVWPFEDKLLVIAPRLDEVAFVVVP